MTPAHHPEGDDLVAYASGASSEWVSLVVACHLTYCAECRSEVALLDQLGGALLDGINPEEGSGPPRETAPAGREPARPRRSSSPIAARLPRPLHDYFRDPSPRWRFLAPGLQHVPLTLTVGSVPARLLQFKPAFVVPEHAHTGLEMLLVLDGELQDSVTREVFRTGDLSRREEGTTHSQRISSNEPCICLVVNETPVDPTSMWGKVLKALTGL